MSQRTIFLYGYSGRRPADLLDAAVSLDAVVWDIRHSPRSRSPEWSRSNLSQTLGDRYRWVRHFGNELYRSSDIQLADPEDGLLLFDHEPRPVALLCICKHSATCHRMTAATFIAERRNVRIIELDDAISEVSGRQMPLFGGGE